VENSAFGLLSSFAKEGDHEVVEDFFKNPFPKGTRPFTKGHSDRKQKIEKKIVDSLLDFRILSTIF
jgi:hypothetical protein